MSVAGVVQELSGWAQSLTGLRNSVVVHVHAISDGWSEIGQVLRNLK